MDLLRNSTRLRLKRKPPSTQWWPPFKGMSPTPSMASPPRQSGVRKTVPPRLTEWITKIQPALKKSKLEVLVEACGKQLCRREIIELRAGRKKPHRRTQQLLESILKRLGFLQRVDQSIAGPWTNGPVPKLPV